MVVRTSVVVPVYNRVDQLSETLRSLATTATTEVSDFEVIVVDDGSTEDVARTVQHTWGRWGVSMDAVKVIRINRSREGWRNPGHAQNVGIRAAQGQNLIICHCGIVPRTLGAVDILANRIEGDHGHAHLGKVEQNGIEVTGSQRPYFLFGGMRWQDFFDLGGYDEDFTHYGYEDDDLAWRMHNARMGFIHWSDVVADHLPHERGAWYGEGMEPMRRLHYHKMSAEPGKTVANRGVEWGAL